MQNLICLPVAAAAADDDSDNNDESDSNGDSGGDDNDDDSDDSEVLEHDEGVSVLLGTLSKDVFEPRTSTGSEVFSLFICLDANKLVLLSFFSLLKTIYPRVSTKPLPNDAKSPLPVDVRRSKTLLLKLPNNLPGFEEARVS